VEKRRGEREKDFKEPEEKGREKPNKIYN